jgi:hypothetical protein
MNNATEKLRVSYRFNKETVALLKKVQSHEDQPVYAGRSITWLIEYAIMEHYRSVVNGQASPQ